LLFHFEIFSDSKVGSIPTATLTLISELLSLFYKSRMGFWLQSNYTTGQKVKTTIIILILLPIFYRNIIIAAGTMEKGQ